MDDPSLHDGAASRASLTAAALLAVLVALTLGTGVSQQHFEYLAAPDRYARELLQGARALRLLITLDDAFIAAYVSATVLFVRALARRRWEALHTLVLAGGVAAGVLDLEENHHLLSLLSLAEQGVALPLAELTHRADLSQLKWMLAHVTFVLLAFALPGRAPLRVGLRAALAWAQLPVGVLCWTLTAPALLLPLSLARYGNMLAGFLALAYLTARPEEPSRDALGDDAAAGSGAPA